MIIIINFRFFFSRKTKNNMTFYLSLSSLVQRLWNYHRTSYQIRYIEFQHIWTYFLKRKTHTTNYQINKIFINNCLSLFRIQHQSITAVFGWNQYYILFVCGFSTTVLNLIMWSYIKTLYSKGRNRKNCPMK